MEDAVLVIIGAQMVRSAYAAKSDALLQATARTFIKGNLARKLMVRANAKCWNSITVIWCNDMSVCIITLTLEGLQRLQTQIKTPLKITTVV